MGGQICPMVRPHQRMKPVVFKILCNSLLTVQGDKVSYRFMSSSGEVGGCYNLKQVLRGLVALCLPPCMYTLETTSSPKLIPNT